MRSECIIVGVPGFLSDSCIDNGPPEACPSEYGGPRGTAGTLEVIFKPGRGPNGCPTLAPPDKLTYGGPIAREGTEEATGMEEENNE